MNNQHKELHELGWNDWFEQRADCKPNESLARVAAIDRGQLLLVDQTGPFRAKLAGSFMQHRHISHELPCVGDWVCLEKQSAEEFGVVQTILERRSLLRRKSAGNNIEYQMIAANMDDVVIVQSCHFDFNLKRLERYLVMVMDSGAKPMILLTKTDLIEPATLSEQLAEIRSADITAPTFALSSVSQEGIEAFKSILLPGKTYCFVGSSGVGKSTLLNQLIGHEQLKTKTVSGTGEGRHTTVRRELISLEGGAMVIDNPGMREFGVIGTEIDIESSFSDITALAADCRYRNCSHTSEPGCAVLENLQADKITKEHFDNYHKLKEESEFYQKSYAEKRRKDRDFGRFIKSAKKDLKND